jgi:hypothetical protein
MVNLVIKLTKNNRKEKTTAQNRRESVWMKLLSQKKRMCTPKNASFDMVVSEKINRFLSMKTFGEKIIFSYKLKRFKSNKEVRKVILKSIVGYIKLIQTILFLN